MAKLGAPRKQPRVVNSLKYLAGANGYQVTDRKKDPALSEDEKKFLPDIIATPFKKGKNLKVFEVEKTISNSTISKSLISLLTFITKHSHAKAFLVVPAKSKEFAEGCWFNLESIIRHYGKRVKGANPHIPLTFLTFEDITEDEGKRKKFIANEGIGKPPVCRYFPRPK